MGVSYLGINISFFTYIALLLFALIIFVIIMIFTAKQRQRRHHMERLRIMKKSVEVDDNGKKK